MDAAVFALLLTIVGTLILARVDTLLRREKTKAIPYDVHKVRRIEMEVWGEYFTPLPETAKPKTLKPPAGNAGIARIKSTYCKRCHEKLGDPKMDTCQTCTFHMLMERKKQREEQAKQFYSAEVRRKAEFKPRSIRLEKNGVVWESTIPSEVPDNAFAEVVERHVGSVGWSGTWIVFKWTDPKTGKQMGLKAMARQAIQP